MRKILFAVIVAALSSSVAAQNPRDEIGGNIRLSGSNQLAYPTPKQTTLTPAPGGYSPFYISHYGRHGSRYLLSRDNYEQPCAVIQRADSLGKLTLLGRDVLSRLRYLCDEAFNRYGELTPLGAEQHRLIARRMYERFSDVFLGDATVDARSTVVIRCILSMENELLELTRLNPQLTIHSDASQHDMYYMNQTDTALNSRKMTTEMKRMYNDFFRNTTNCDGVMQKIFNDSSYVRRSVDAKRLTEQLFSLAQNIQNCESRTKVTLYDLFTDEELYANWRVANVWWYLNYGRCPLNGGTQPFSQRNLLRRIIEEADSCIALPHPGATLRFGHETMVLPLVCLMNLNGYGQQIDRIDQIDRKGWANYRIFPMAANVQIVFYRRDAGDKDILIKVLLNEEEATLPIKTDAPPYYRWEEVRAYYLNMLNNYDKNVKH